MNTLPTKDTPRRPGWRQGTRLTNTVPSRPRASCAWSSTAWIPQTTQSPATWDTVSQLHRKAILLGHPLENLRRPLSQVFPEACRHPGRSGSQFSGRSFPSLPPGHVPRGTIKGAPEPPSTHARQHMVSTRAVTSTPQAT